MIIDSLSNLKHYQQIVPQLAVALKQLQRITEWNDGEKYFFEGGLLFFQQGVTKPLKEAQFEAHRKYIEVQVVLAGSEYLAWSALENLTEIHPYDETADVQKFFGENTQLMKISTGMAYIAFPWDGRKGAFHIEEPEYFTKAVIKIAITN